MESEASEPTETGPAPDDSTSADAAISTTSGPSRRRAIVAWSAGIAALLVVGVIVAFVQVSASRSFDAAGARLIIAANGVAKADDSFEKVSGDVARSLVTAPEIVAAADDTLVDVKARSALSKTIASALDAAEDSAALLERDIDAGAFDKPFWMWELWSETASLDARTATADDLAVDLSTADETLVADADAMAKAALALYESVPEKATAFEGANISARAETVLNFRDAAAKIADLSGVGPDAAVAFSALATRADLLAASSNAELAEKAGPLYPTRIEIEAYARSISGGIVLDFDWADVVNGQGGYWGIGGLASWSAERGGFTTITLSNSVAEWWTSDAVRAADSRALVTHEVGHAISGKCYEKFDWKSSDANEEWATAWAISMGHTAQGNGVQAYGYPSQAMIDAAATCR